VRGSMNDQPGGARVPSSQSPPPTLRSGEQPGSAERLQRRARTFVYERLALATAVIWTLGTAFLLFTIVPYVEHPQAYIFIASIVPVPFAAAPWLFYGVLSRAVARRWAAREASATAPPRR